MSALVTVTKDLPILRLELHRPNELNALSFELLAELKTALDEHAHNPEYRAVVLSGAGRAFSAGADLRVMPADVNVEQALSELYNPIVHTIATLPKPVVALINGVVAGAGLSLALACDLRIGTKQSSYVAGFHGIGLTLDAGMSWFLPRLVGEARARELTLLNRTITAEEARHMGLLSALVDTPADAEPILTALAHGPTQAYARTKQELLATWEHTLPEQLALEARLQQEAANTADFAEGVQAFAERRAPRFGGK